MIQLRKQVASIALALLLCACAASTTPDNVGGETHFLAGCVTECGAGLACVCGVCTLGCSDNNSCQAQNANATCEAAGTPIGACANPATTPVCDLRCDDQSDCTSLGAGYTCEAGSCRKLESGCVRDGIVYPASACGDGGMDAGITLPELACLNDDTDAGAIDLQPITPRVIDCPALDRATALPGAVVLGSFWNLEHGVVLSDDAAYWGDGNHEPFLQRSLIDGSGNFDYGIPTTATAFAPAGCRLHYAPASDSGEIHIDTIDVLGGQQQRIASAPGASVVALRVDDTYDYFWTEASLFRVGRGGGTIIELAQVPSGHVPPNHQTFVTTSTNALYWIDSDADPATPDTLSAMWRDGTRAPLPQITGLANPQLVLVDIGYLYIALAGTYDELGNNQGDARIVRMIVGSDELEPVVAASASAMATDETDLYWLEQTTDGSRLKRIAKDGRGPIATVFDNLPQSTALRVDQDALVWASYCDFAGGYVMRIPKP